MMASGERQDGAGTEIVPATSQPGSPSKGLLWYAGIAVSVAIMARYPMLGVMCLAMGLRTQAERFDAKGLGIGVGIACGVLAAWGVAFGFESMLYAVAPVGICIAVSALMWKRRASVLAISLVVVASAAFSMVVDAVALAGERELVLLGGRHGGGLLGHSVDRAVMMEERLLFKRTLLGRAALVRVGDMCLARSHDAACLRLLVLGVFGIVLVVVVFVNNLDLDFDVDRLGAH